MYIGPACLRALCTTEDVHLGRRPKAREEGHMPGKAYVLTSEARAVDEHYKYSLLSILGSPSGGIQGCVPLRGL